MLPMPFVDDFKSNQFNSKAQIRLDSCVTSAYPQNNQFRRKLSFYIFIFISRYVFVVFMLRIHFNV